MLERLIDTALYVGFGLAAVVIFVGGGHLLVYGLAKILKQEPRFIAGSLVLLYFIGVVIVLGYYFIKEGNYAIFLIIACIIPLIPFFLKRGH